jgi:hypothetical protein
MIKLYCVTPADGDFFLYLTERYSDAELFALCYKGIFSPVKIKEYIPREATREELEEHEAHHFTGFRNESIGET